MVLNFIKQALKMWLSEKRTLERDSPFPRINYKKKSILINGKSYKTSSIENTNSMDPVIDDGLTIIRKDYIPERDILASGDIVLYKPDGERYKHELICHRIISVDVDELGEYYTLKGDNNFMKDPWRIRDEHIKEIVVGVLY